MFLPLFIFIIISTVTKSYKIQHLFRSVDISECKSFYDIKSFNNYRSYRLYQQNKSSAQSDKVRVRLLQDLPQGKKNELVFVSKALWTNVLLPKKQAIQVTDEQLEKLNQQSLNQALEEINKARELIKKITESSENKDIHIVRKSGANGQLFGSVNNKVIIEQLKTLFPTFEATITSRSFQIITIQEYKVDKDDPSIKEVIKGDVSEIRRSGSYRVRLRVHPKVEEIDFDLIVGS